jgi:PAS domain S-box-containing protein
MPTPSQHKKTSASPSIRRYAILLIGVWTAVIGGSLAWNILEIDHDILHQAETAARAVFNNDLVYRRWAASHGGVYVPITDNTPPSPHLSHINERDIETPSGRKLTLVNPAYMTRQVFELSHGQYGMHGHLTSLKPIRSGNEPDPWERKALEAFKRGEIEVSREEEFDGEQCLRLMRPMIVEKRCLKCHAEQGYKEGDIRGGISISAPMAPYREGVLHQAMPVLVGHGLLWVLGVAGLGLGGRNILKRERARTQAEGQLQESEEKFREFVEGTDDLITQVDCEGNFIYVNDVAKGIFGLSPEECVGLSAFSFIHPDDRERTSIWFEQLIGDRAASGTIENRQVSRDGSVHDLLWTGNLHYGEDGELTLVNGIATDITERKHAEEALQASEERFRNLFERSPLPYQSLDDGGYIIEANQAWIDLLGYSRQEVIGQWFGNFLAPECVSDFRGKFPCFKKAGETHGVEFQMMLKDGTRHVITFDGRIGYDAKGDFQQTHCILHDVTEQRLREQEIADMAKFPSESPNSIFRIDVDGSVLYANANCESLLDAFGSVVGQPAPEAWRELSAEALRSASSKEIEMEHDCRFISFEIVPVVEANYVNWYGRDITDRKRMQEIAVQTEKMMTVGGLTAGIAHEINNPLAVIVQGAQNALMLMDSAHQRNVEWSDAQDIDFAGVQSYLDQRGVVSMVQKIRDSGVRVTEIVQNMLQFSRGGSTYCCLSADLGEVMDQAVELAGVDLDLEQRFNFRDIDIKRQYDSDLPQAECMKAEIQQVFLNLLINAAHSMCHGQAEREPCITLRATRQGSFARIEIEDNGSGMSEDVRKHIFEPFFTTKDVGQGTGLGLFVAYFIITNKHQGTIKVKSSPGNGAKFTILIPLVCAVSPNANETSAELVVI